MYGENRGARGTWMIAIALLLDAVLCVVVAMQVDAGAAAPRLDLQVPPELDADCRHGFRLQR